MTAPDARDELREALADALPCHPEFDGTEIADMILPVVTAYAERLARERAAEELRAAADYWGAGSYAEQVAQDLNARADALAADDQPDGAR